MWGNRLGWIISGAMAALFGYVLVLGAMPAGMESPTGTLSAVGMQVPALPIDPLTLFKPGTSDKDAGPLYREAMQDYDQNPDRYTELQNDLPQALANPPIGVQKIVAARDCNHMDLFAKDPTELINYENKTPGINALHSIGTLTDQIALYAATEKHDLATTRKYGEALFALGYNLATERVRFSEWSQGVGFMQSAALDLAAAEPGQAKKYQDFNDQVGKYMNDTIIPFWQDLDGVEPTVTSKSGFTISLAGDFYQLAQSSPEHMWRVEAILRLGRLTHDAPTRGDQLVARHFLTKLADDTTLDPQIHAAAIAAHDIITNEAEYNRIGGSSEYRGITVNSKKIITI